MSILLGDGHVGKRRNSSAADGWMGTSYNDASWATGINGYYGNQPDTLPSPDGRVISAALPTILWHTKIPAQTGYPAQNQQFRHWFSVSSGYEDVTIKIAADNGGSAYLDGTLLATDISSAGAVLIEEESTLSPGLHLLAFGLATTGSGSDYAHVAILVEDASTGVAAPLLRQRQRGA